MLTPDSGYVVVGNSNSKKGQVTGLHFSNQIPDAPDIWAVKLDLKLKLQSEMCLGGTRYDYGYSVVQNKKRNYAIAGHTTSPDGDVTGYNDSLNPQYPDYWILNLKSTAFDSKDLNILDSTAASANQITITPSITTSAFMLILIGSSRTPQPITISLFNTSGKPVQTIQTQIEDGFLSLPMTLDAALPKGLYFIRANAGDKNYIGKVYKDRW